MFFDCMDFAANAACPQRPAWQIKPVEYKWAQSVFQDRNPHCVWDVKKEAKPRQYLKVFGRMFSSLFLRCQITQSEEPICNM